jgi:hypothetical protein
MRRFRRTVLGRWWHTEERDEYASEPHEAGSPDEIRGY